MSEQKKERKPSYFGKDSSRTTYFVRCIELNIEAFGFSEMIRKLHLLNVEASGPGIVYAAKKGKKYKNLTFLISPYKKEKKNERES